MNHGLEGEAASDLPRERNSIMTQQQSRTAPRLFWDSGKHSNWFFEFDLSPAFVCYSISIMHV